jgi:hypothetical protein
MSHVRAASAVIKSVNFKVRDIVNLFFPIVLSAVCYGLVCEFCFFNAIITTKYNYTGMLVHVCEKPIFRVFSAQITRKQNVSFVKRSNLLLDHNKDTLME